MQVRSFLQILSNFNDVEVTLDLIRSCQTFDVVFRKPQLSFFMTFGLITKREPVLKRKV